MALRLRCTSLIARQRAHRGHAAHACTVWATLAAAALPATAVCAVATPLRRFTSHAHSHHRHHQQKHKRHEHSTIDQGKIHASYRMLGVNVGSDMATIRQRYLQLAKQLHPDMQTAAKAATDDDADAVAGGSNDAAAPSSAGFQRVHDAYMYLSGLHADVLQDARARAIAHGLATEADFAAGGSRRDGADAAAAAASALDDAAPPSSSQPVPNAAAGHTLVQHRDYLRNEGVGTGASPMARDAQYRSHRLSRGVDAALDYKMERLWADDSGEAAPSSSGGSPLADAAASAKELAAFDSLLSITRASANTKHISSATLVEEQIKDAVSRWDLRELPDFGRPLSHLAHDSGVVSDPLEHKLHQILLREGVLPDWLQLEREIDAQSSAIQAELDYVWNGLVTREQFDAGTKLKQTLRAQSADHTRAVTPAEPTAASSDPTSAQDPAASSSASPASATDSVPAAAAALGLSPSAPFGLAWALAHREYLSALLDLNSKIDAFNFAVPLTSRQRVHQSAVGVFESMESRPPDASKLDEGTARVRERNAPTFARRRGAASVSAAANTKHHKKRKKQPQIATAAAASVSATASSSVVPGGSVVSPLEDARPLDLVSQGSISSTLFAASPVASASAAAAAVASARASLASSRDALAPLDLDVLDLDTATLTEQEIEALYRSLAPDSAPARARVAGGSGGGLSEEEAAAARRRKAATALSPVMVTCLLASAVCVLALPLWLVRRSRRAAVAASATVDGGDEDD